MSETEVLRAHSVDKAALRRVSKPICHPREVRRNNTLFAVSVGRRSPFAARQVPVSQAIEVMPEILSGENNHPAVDDGLAPEMFMGREVRRCRHCQLKQFLTQGGACRKCRGSLAPEPTPDMQPAAPSANGEVRSFGNLFDRVDVAFSVKLMRSMNGFSQKDLAARMQVPRTYVSKLENHKCVPGVESIEKFAIALNVTPYILVTIAEAACQ